MRRVPVSQNSLSGKKSPETGARTSEKSTPSGIALLNHSDPVCFLYGSTRSDRPRLTCTNGGLKGPRLRKPFG